MNVWDILILVIIAAAVFAGIRSRRKRGSSCCGGGSSCSGCASGSCSSCAAGCGKCGSSAGEKGNTPGAPESRG